MPSLNWKFSEANQYAEQVHSIQANPPIWRRRTSVLPVLFQDGWCRWSGVTVRALHHGG